VWITSATKNALTPTSIALGNFDGIHRGHQQVVQPVLKRKQPSEVLALTPGGNPINATASQTPYATVVTFNPHPREFFSGQSRQLLTPLPEKVAILEDIGVEQLILLPFDRELAALSPETFVEKILIQELQAQQICVGEDFRFGKGRTGTAQDLSAIAPRFGAQVQIIPLHTCGEERISSSAIRHALKNGQIPEANRLLGRLYTLTGSVVTGQKLGRTLGFPTANLDVSPEKFLPRFGVYSANVQLSQQTEFLPAVLNIGCRPTVSGEMPTIEIHLLDWSGDLYGQTLSVYLHTFIRPEQKFSSLDNLRTQIAQDCQVAKQDLLS
jgi:riboflavin kinase/FMN adenylyltransferase